MRRILVTVGFVVVLFASARAQEPAPAHAHSQPFTVEYYYKAKWGFAGEFLRLFKKNYYPVLAKMREDGRILSIVSHAPRYHATEDGRWDLRVTIVWRDVVTAHEDHHPQTIVAKLFPDLETYAKEEQRRFELLIAHWDVPVEDKDLATP